MAKTLNKTGITTGNTVRAYHVTQSVDAFTGIDAYDITISGSLVVTGSQTTTGDATITGSLTVSGSQTGVTSAVEKINLGKYSIKTLNSHDAGFLGQFGGQLIISASDFTYKNPLFVIQRHAFNGEGLDLWAQRDFYAGGPSYSNGEISTIFSVSGSDLGGRYGEIHLGNELKSLNLQPSIKILGHVTASGNISSSLQLLGKSLEIEETASIGRSLTVGTTLTVAETITGDGVGITNLQRPISNSVSTNFSASTSNSGFYFRAGGNVTCSIGTSSIYLVPIGVEYEIFQTSSAGNFSFVTGSSTIILNSKDGKTKLTGQFSAATLKKVGGDEWDLIGDLS